MNSGSRGVPSGGGGGTGPAGGSSHAHRRYGVGDRVLVCNHQSRWSNLVNRYGFPEGSGHSPEEQQGPYVYVLATVKRIHYGENAQYYTVQRADTGSDQRADAEWMEPIRNARGEAAALRAAAESVQLTAQPGGKAAAILGSSLTSGTGRKGKCDGVKRCLRSTCKAVASPFALFAAFLNNRVGKPAKAGMKWTYGVALGQATLFMNGLKPYICAVRVTGINLLVLCSTWYMFIDQMRLAFCPPSADFALSIVSCSVWVVLLLELFLEVFIRPDGYRQLLSTEKAYAPSTVRHINKFHLCMEVLSLVFYVPEILCLFSSKYQCGGRPPNFSLLNASLMSVLGPDRDDAFYGRAYYAMIRLRIFGLVRHWKQMWLNNTIADPSVSQHKKGLIRGVILPRRVRGAARANAAAAGATRKEDVANTKKYSGEKDKERLAREAKQQAAEQKKQDKYLTNATNIGTALLVINSHRALLILIAIVGLLPVISTLQVNGGANTLAPSMTGQLQSTNLIANNTDASTCEFFEESVMAWLAGTTGMKGPINQSGGVYVMWLQILPVRCDFQGGDGVVTAAICENGNNTLNDEVFCQVWEGTNSSTTTDELAAKAGIRPGAIEVFSQEKRDSLLYDNGTVTKEWFKVSAVFNETHSVTLSNYSSFLLQALLLVFVLAGLSILRLDASRLVLGPLRRMLKIVALYAKNPLASAKKRTRRRGRGKGSVASGDTSDESDCSTDGSDSETEDAKSPEDQLGNYETEQLINAVTKITDLLRKCWGVAGAGIISSNLARQDDGLTAVFNPCVPGRSVYALFGFAAISGFDHMLRALGGEIMILINDVATVLHGEVYRWGFGDSGQCNKNLGAAFLMVYRIGDVKEVKEKRDMATDVIFDSTNTEKHRTKSSQGIRRRNRVGTVLNKTSSDASASSASAIRLRKKVIKTPKTARAESLSLASLPGINVFTDRAVLGLLKTYAGIYRDQKLINWKDDFRLSLGVGAFSVDMIFGMDAGWAVEGAVGSEYKIDATYLSPHVNMASRMMSACKQYGVNILISQAVEELLSDQARAKFRHLDTVTVKGSSVKQKIFTHDARHKGVDFFLFERSQEDADLDAERYTPNIWNTDMDLRAMRQHVSDEFLDEFKKGRDLYLAGNWKMAAMHLKAADDIMVDTVMDQGYVEDELKEIKARIMDGEDAEAEEAHVRNEMGDGPSRRLLAYMEARGGVAPKSWNGYRPLTSK